MKHVKKLLSVILVMIMALTLALPAAAANNGSITIENETEGHQYEVYQIFIGDVSGNVLSNIQWGSAYETEPGIAAPKAAEELSGENGPDAALVGDFLEKYPVEKLYGTLSFADGKYSISNIPTGYYLIKDKDKSQDGGYDAYTQYIVQVVGTVSMKPKSAVPSVDKQVHDEPEDSENGVADGWGETADQQSTRVSSLN